MTKKILLSIILLIFISSTTILKAKQLTFISIHNMPKSVEKDYYIWRYLMQKTTTASQAKRIIKEVNRLNKKLRNSYKKKTNLKAPEPIEKEPGTLPEHVWKNRSKANKAFRKGLSLLKEKNPKVAEYYLKEARKYYYKQYEIDKALFWLYISTKKVKYIEELQKSKSPNIYALIALDTIDASYPHTITQRFKRKKHKYIEVNDPIAWAKIKQKMHNSTNNEINRLADNYASQDCLGIYTYLKAKACTNVKPYFPLPYKNSMQGMSVSRKALIYAIARQESRFVPASISRSFALGMMQFMPFLIKHVAKEKGYRMDLDEIFNPDKAIEFADFHLDYLNKYIKHPLFVAYAYNAGIGFTKRFLRKKNNFRSGPYEPYMSMEMMANVEAREYGKKVLANYVIYMNKLGVRTRISPLIVTLGTPSKTDKFRK